MKAHSPDETPRARAVRLTGRLDGLAATNGNIVLALDDGTSITGRLEAHDIDQLKDLFNARVVISGIAQFRPSGKLLVIDVEHLGRARDGDELFARIPTTTVPSAGTTPLQDAATGVSAFFNTWPGEESDEELLRDLEAIR